MSIYIWAKKQKAGNSRVFASHLFGNQNSPTRCVSLHAHLPQNVWASITPTPVNPLVGCSHLRVFTVSAFISIFFQFVCKKIWLFYFCFDFFPYFFFDFFSWLFPQFFFWGRSLLGQIFLTQSLPSLTSSKLCEFKINTFVSVLRWSCQNIILKCEKAT